MKGWSGYQSSPFKQGTPPEKTKEPSNDKKHNYELVDANGRVIKSISKEEYIKYQNEPGSDKPTKRTTDPDPYGRKKGGTVSEPK